MTSKSVRRAKRFAWLALLSMFASVFLVSPLAAQDVQADFEVIRVDLRGNDGLVTVRSAEFVEPLEMTITAGGDVIEARSSVLGNSSVESWTVLIVDDSGVGDVVAGFSSIRNAALTYLDGLSPGTRVLLLRGSGNTVQSEALTGFTDNHAAVRTAIETLGTPEGASIMWNSISDGADVLNDKSGDGIRSVVAVAASPGLSSTIPVTVAEGNLLTANAGLTVILPTAPNSDMSSYVRVANSVRGGGVFRSTDSVSMDAAAQAAVDYHRQTIVGRFDASDLPDGINSIEVSVNGQSQRVRLTPGALVTGAGLVAPEITSPGRIDGLTGDYGLLAAVGLGVLAAFLFSYSMMLILSGNDNTLNSTLAMYSADERAEEKRAADDAFDSVRSRIVEQVVERAESAADRGGNLKNTTSMLEKAEIPLRVGEAMAVQVGIVIVALLLGFLMFGGPIGALVLALPAAFLPMTYVKWKVKQRRKKLERQLPDTLTLLSSTLKAGYSFLQGIDAVGSEAEEPLAGEFRRTVNETRLGRDVDDALDDLAERVGSIDLLWAVVAIKIQREVGGNLAELLMTVADTMTARSRLRGEVASLTAEGRMSAYVLVLLPVLVGMAMYVMNKDYISTLWSHPFGYAAMGAGVLGIIVGSLWMRKIIDIKI